MWEFVKMGSSINPDIQLTGDCPSLNATKMMPALDIQLWVEDGKVRHQHFRKVMANNLVMMECSAQPTKTKRTTLTQEGIRILKNTSLDLPWEVAATHLSDLSGRMKASGYNEKFRLQVIQSAVDGFNKMVKVEREGGGQLTGQEYGMKTIDRRRSTIIRVIGSELVVTMSLFLCPTPQVVNLPSL